MLLIVDRRRLSSIFGAALLVVERQPLLIPHLRRHASDRWGSAPVGYPSTPPHLWSSKVRACWFAILVWSCLIPSVARHLTLSPILQSLSNHTVIFQCVSYLPMRLLSSNASLIVQCVSYFPMRLLSSNASLIFQCISYLPMRLLSSNASLIFQSFLVGG